MNTKSDATGRKRTENKFGKFRVPKGTRVTGFGEWAENFIQKEEYV